MMHMSIDRRKCLRSMFALGWMGHCPARADQWPTKPVKIVVPFPPGGYADVYARLLAAHMARTWGQPVTVDNQAGAGGILGVSAVANAPSDGHTLLMGTVGTHAINVTLFPKLPYNPVTQFTAVSFIVEAEGVLVVPTSSPAKSVQELVELAREKKFSFASAGPGTTSHLAGELFKQKNKLDITHVPYKGNSPALVDLIGGQTSMMFATLQTVLPHLQSGKLRALAVLGALGPNSSPMVRGLPSLAQSPYMGQALENWTGLFSGPDTPAPVVKKIHAEVQRILQLPQVQARMATEGMRFARMSSDEFAQFVKTEILTWRDIVHASGATME